MAQALSHRVALKLAYMHLAIFMISVSTCSNLVALRINRPRGGEILYFARQSASPAFC